MKILLLLNRYLVENPEIKSVRKGMIKVIPVIMIGSFALVFKSLPVPEYQSFISNFGSGIFLSLFSLINNASFGMLSIYLTVAISYCYTQERSSEQYTECVLIALVCFALLAGVFEQGFSSAHMGVTAIFTAIFSAVAASKLYIYFEKNFKFKTIFRAEGADMDFNNALVSLLPSFATIAVFAVANYAIISIWSVGSLHELFITGVNSLFDGIHQRIYSGYLFVLASSLLWFFGIHGGNVLEGVVNTQFALNEPSVFTDPFFTSIPTEILTKPFFDSFVLMGGCGTTLSLLIAILLFGKRNNTKKLSKIAAFPMIFNINELIVFGLPVIFNPFMFIPFITVPLVSFTISYFAVFFNLVPLTHHPIEWTTPVILSGYLATGSAAGIILQLVNLTVGTLIYWPFVILYERNKETDAKKQIQELVATLQEAEKLNTPITLTSMNGTNGSVAKYLANDIAHAVTDRQIKLYYQPQFDNEKKCIGAEALLRWNHPVFGMIYPPLVIKLAEEADVLTKLEQFIVSSAMNDLENINTAAGRETSICVNISAATLQHPTFIPFLRIMSIEHQFKNESICFEITEQMSLNINENVEAIFSEIKRLGYMLAVDDFAMGATSIKYLQNGKFDLVKIDGELVKSMLANPRSKDIVESIVRLSRTLGFNVLAEYVETESQQKDLESIGCFLYQGYLYSPAVTIEKYIEIQTFDSSKA